MITPSKVYPLRGKIFVEIESDEKISSGGIILVESLKTKPIMKVIVIKKGAKTRAVKDEHWRDLDIKAVSGDTLHIKRTTNPTSGFRQFEQIGKKANRYMFVRFEDVLAVDSHGTLEASQDYVIVKILYKKSTGSIVIPDSAKQYNGEFVGEVRSVGADNKDGLSLYDRIYFVRHEGHPVEFNGEQLIALKPKWVVAVNAWDGTSKQ